jgi:hypothetical protein
MIVQGLSLVAFLALLVPYVNYSRTNKALVHESCKAKAQTLYENNLAQCDADSSRSLSLRGGVLGLSWAEMIAFIAVGGGCQYLVWLLQGWVIVRTFFVNDQERK